MPELTWQQKLMVVMSVIIVILTAILVIFSDYQKPEAEAAFGLFEETEIVPAVEAIPETITEAIPEIVPASTPAPTARLAFVGDLMCHEEQLNAALDSSGGYDFNYVFRYIAPYIQAADFAVGNLETTLRFSGFAGYPAFRSPPAFAEAIKNAGFDMVTTGNNHSFDGGVTGVHSTIEILNEIGLMYTGTYQTPEERDEITLVEVNGFKLAFLNYTMHTNGINFGENNFMVKIIYKDLVEQSVIDFDLIREDMARARELEPDFIIVLPHIGIEYYGTMGRNWDSFNRSDTRWVNWVQTLELFLEEGADIVMNHHPHTLLPAEFINYEERRAFIAYSMANFVSAQRTQPRETSAVFYLDITRDDEGNAYIAAASYIPVWVRQNDPAKPGLDFTILPVTNSLTADLRQQDVSRIQQVHLDVTHMLSGEPIPLEENEYQITRERNPSDFPGLPLWGALPWQ